LKQKGRKDRKHVPFSIDVKGGEKSCEKLLASVRGSSKESSYKSEKRKGEKFLS